MHAVKPTQTFSDHDNVVWPNDDYDAARVPWAESGDTGMAVPSVSSARGGRVRPGKSLSSNKESRGYLRRSDFLIGPVSSISSSPLSPPPRTLKAVRRPSAESALSLPGQYCIPKISFVRARVFDMGSAPLVWSAETRASRSGLGVVRKMVEKEEANESDAAQMQMKPPM